MLFGTKRLRNMGGDLGAAIKGFKSSIKTDDEKPEEDSENVVEKTENNNK